MPILPDEFERRQAVPGTENTAAPRGENPVVSVSVVSDPVVSIIVPVWNSPALIRKCLAALTAQTYPRNRFEILVVDNGSTDETPEAIGEFPGIRMLSELRPGSYHARNAGLAVARGRYVAFTDADCIPEPDWLATGIAAAEAGSNGALPGIVAGRIELFRAGDGHSDACEKYERVFAFDQEKNVRYGHCFTANWISPRDVLVEMGGFDGNLKSGGDFAMSRRIRDRGYPILYVPEMTVRHPVRASLAELASKRRRVIGGRWHMGPSRFALPRWILVTLREAAGKTRALLFESRLSPVDKLKVGGVLVSLTCVTIAELIRISRGGTVRRA